MQQEQESAARQHVNRHGIPSSEMQYWGKVYTLVLAHDTPAEITNISAGYKFETLSTLPRPWAETDRDYIENRDSEIVNNKEQYCSVVRTGFGNTVVCLGGEVDASKPGLPAPSPMQNNQPRSDI
jgi:hypothetical protein